MPATPADISGQSVSVWMRTGEMPDRSPLTEDVKADVCIVGAGIAGISAAYHLISQGRSVIVIDDGPVAGGETGRTTAHLSSALDDRFMELERLHGKEGARLAYESHTAAIERIEAIVRELSIDCDFERLDGYLFVPPGQDTQVLDRELEACRRIGLVDVTRVRRAPLTSFDTGPCLRWPRQGQFHPTRYIAALTRAIEHRGGRICCHSRAQEITGGSDANVVTVQGPVVRAQHIIVATNTPVNDLVTMHTKQAAYRTYVVAGPVPHGAVHKALYWDTPDPYHYVRLQALDADYDLLIVGGEDHKTGQADGAQEPFVRLENWARQRFPLGETAYRWSGQVMEPVDCLAFIGRNPNDDQNVYIATGDSGHGMTHGAIAGMLLCDLVLGRKNRWADLYDPSRRTLRASGEFTRENVNVAAQYASWVTPGEVGSSDDLAAGSGAILRQGLRKVALYRDDAGKLHACSATCPHLGCVVEWNPAEKTWDCPCHGSRFDPQGEVINGPALGNLTRQTLT